MSLAFRGLASHRRLASWGPGDGTSSKQAGAGPWVRALAGADNFIWIPTPDLILASDFNRLSSLPSNV